MEYIRHPSHLLHDLATYAGDTYDPQQRLATDGQRLILLFYTTMFGLVSVLSPLLCYGGIIGMVTTGSFWPWAIVSASCILPLAGRAFVATNYDIRRVLDRLSAWYPNHLNRGGFAPIHYIHHDAGELEELIRSGTNVNLRDRYGFTALEHVIASESILESRGQLSRIDALIRGGANRTTRDNQPILYSCIHHCRDPGVFDYFLGLGENPNAEAYGKPLLYWALLEGLSGVVIEKFMAAGANRDVRIGGLPLLEYARRWKTPEHILQAVWGDAIGTAGIHAYCSDADVMRSLSPEALDNLRDCDIFDASDKSLLSLAISNPQCRDETILEIIQKGADINREEEGKTPFIALLTHRPKLELIEAFDRAGVDFNPNIEVSPLELAVSRQSPEDLICYLIDRGAKIISGHLFVEQAIRSDYRPEFFHTVLLPQVPRSRVSLGLSRISSTAYQYVRSRRMMAYLEQVMPAAPRDDWFLKNLMENGAPPDIIDWFLDFDRPIPPAICHYVRTREQVIYLEERLGANSPLWKIRGEQDNLPIHDIELPLSALQALIERNLNSVHDSNKFGETPLLAHRGSLRKVKFLLENGADVHARDRQGRSFLDIAIGATTGWDPCRIARIKLINCLLAYGAGGAVLEEKIADLDLWWKSLESEALQRDLIVRANQARDSNDGRPLPQDIARVMLLQTFAYFSLLPHQKTQREIGVSRGRRLAQCKLAAEESQTAETVS